MKALMVLFLCCVATIGFGQHKSTSTASTAKFTRIDQMLTFPGGTEKLYQYLQDSCVHFPADLLADRPEKIQVRFTVLEDGMLSQIRMVPSIDSVAEGNVIQMIRRMPRWIPGRNKGVVVPVEMYLRLRLCEE